MSVSNNFGIKQNGYPKESDLTAVDETIPSSDDEEMKRIQGGYETERARRPFPVPNGLPQRLPRIPLSPYDTELLKTKTVVPLTTRSGSALSLERRSREHPDDQRELRTPKPSFGLIRPIPQRKRVRI